MESEGGTERVRGAAGGWSLHGDRALLHALQHLHQKVMCRCAATSGKLEAMAAALDHAATALDNVNNRFMSLSGSQFVERRVYDDDDVTHTDNTHSDVTLHADTDNKDPGESLDEVGLLRRGVECIEKYHEDISIPPDTDSDSDTDTRLVLRPRDLYRDRRLPHRIGTHHFNHSWHAGLLASESETESSSELEERDDAHEQYSDDAPVQHAVHLANRARHRTVSTSSSESAHWSGSDAWSRDTAPRQVSQDAAISPISRDTRPRQVSHDTAVSPAQVAAELARRLGATAVAQPSEPQPEGSPVVCRPLYKAGPPPPGVVFPSEPPPIDSQSPSSEDEPEDIFADIHTPIQSQPYTGGNNTQNPADNIFAKVETPPRQTQPYASGNKAHNTVDVDDDGFSDASDERQHVRTETIHSPKKPIGGISVFGSEAAHSIGAAIMRRRQDHTGDSDDEGTRQRNGRDSNIQHKQIEKRGVTPEIQKPKDIFDELFAKSEKMNKKAAAEAVKEIKVEKKENKKIDLFDDSIFDDIDDIFGSNTIKVADNNDKKRKSIFDDEDDDLFSNIGVTTKSNDSKAGIKDTKPVKTEIKAGIFDSDDDLFTEPVNELPKPSIPKETDKNSYERKDKQITKPVDSVFDDEDDELFKIKTKDKNLRSKKATNTLMEDKPLVGKSSEGLFDDVDVNDDLFTDTGVASQKQYLIESGKETNLSNRTDELKQTIITENSTTDNKNNQPNTLFDNDEDLFSNKSIQEVNYKESKPEVAQKPKLPKLKPEISEPESKNKNDEHIDIIDQKLSNIPDEKKNTDVLKSPVNEDNTNDNKTKQSIFNDSEDELFYNKSSISEQSEIKSNKNTNIEIKEQMKVNTLFSDINDDDLFLNVNTDAKDKLASNYEKETGIPAKDMSTDDINKSVTTSQKSNSLVTSPDIFEDDIDNLFISSNKNNNLSRYSTNQASDEVSSKEKTEDVTSTVLNRSDQDEDDVESILNNTQSTLTNVIGDSKEGNSIKSPIDKEFDDNIFINQKNNLEENKSEKMLRNIDNYNKTKVDVPVAESEDSNIVEEKDKDNNLFNVNIIKNKNIVHDVASNNFKDETNKTNVSNEIYADVPNLSNTADSINKNKVPSEPPKPDIFAVFNNQPPVFEKPKEPKKSKNVNALFDDDSDDEALFFKKNDTILDEDPEDFSPNMNSNTFEIFRNEPPAIDVNFEIKIKESETPIFKHSQVTPDLTLDKTNNSLADNNNFDDLFTSKAIESKEEVLQETKIEPKVENDATLTEETNKNDSIQTEISKASLAPLKKAEIAEKHNDESADKSDGCPRVETKKIGKLKPMNLNINVNTLLPGASPKKTQRIEQTDGQAVSISKKSDEELNTSLVAGSGSKLVKSVSFDGEPESPPLDNKISKERAKIQVKRRPSTRRARREAVRKSGIDFGEDSTDNSSSFDDNTKSKDVKVESTDDRTDKLDIESGPPSLIFDNNDISEQNNSLCKEIEKHVTEVVERKENKIRDDVIETEVVEHKQSSSESTPSRDVKSKVVYVLNDEDIFSDTKATTQNDSVVDDPLVSQQPEMSKKSRILNIVDDDDDIFKTIPVAITDNSIESKDNEAESITTLGKVYKSENKIVQKKEISILDIDEDDDDLFKTFSKAEPKPKNTETEIQKQKMTKNIDIKAENSKPKDIFAVDKAIELDKAKKSLFDDESDDESDLFSSRPVKNRAATKSSTLFASDSDEELFSGHKTDKVSSSTTSNKTEIKDDKHDGKRERAHGERETEKEVKAVKSIFGDDDDDDEALFGARRS